VALHVLQSYTQARSIFLLVAICTSVACTGATDHENPKISLEGAITPVAEIQRPAYLLNDPIVFDQKIKWVMHERYESGFESYNTTVENKYDPSYVYPDSWGIGFDICDEYPRKKERVFQWTVSSSDGEFEQKFTSGDCAPDSEVRLPELKPHTAQVTVLDGGVEQVTHAIAFTPADRLIVSMGDSIASGESLNTFVDRQCHRSRISGHAKAAEQLERDDPHTSVTFLFLACSGAELEEGVIFPQTEFQPYRINSLSEAEEVIQGEIELRGEISQLKDLVAYLCDPRTAECATNPRSIDTVFLTIGANDLGWKDYIMACATGRSLDDIEVEDVLPIAVLANLKNVSWSDIKDQPIQQLGNALSGLLDVGLLFIDELRFAAYNWLFGDEDSCGTESATRAASLGMFALKDSFAIVDYLLDGGGSSLIQKIVYDNAYEFLDRAEGTRKQFLVCNFGSDLQRLNSGFNCSTSGNENITSSLFNALKSDELYLLQYPYDIFSDRDGNRGGCGLLGGVSEEDAQWFYELGQNLDGFYRTYADYFRWNYVLQINSRFETEDEIHHGYCAGSDSWYEGMTEAFFDNNFSGTLHPNKKGHAVIAEELLEVIARPKPEKEEDYNVIVHIEDAVVIGPEDTTDNDKLTIRAHERLKRGGGEFFASYEFPRNSALILSAHQTEAGFTIALDDQIVIRATTEYSHPASFTTCFRAEMNSSSQFGCDPTINNEPLPAATARYSTIVKTFTVRELIEGEVSDCRETRNHLNQIVGANVSHLCQFEQADYVEGQSVRSTHLTIRVDVSDVGELEDCRSGCVIYPVDLR